MTELLIVAVLVAAGVGAWWLLRDLRLLTAGADSPRGRSVAVIVPARDEETSLPHLLGSLALPTPAADEVVVVDDGSTDATSSVARRAGATVLDPGEPPAGWTGKAWACQVGADATRADLLLFLDADTVLSPDALGGLLELHARRGGLVSVQPFHTPVRPYEQLSSYFNVVSLMASAAFRAGDHSTVPMAFGPCLLTTRADYEHVGGHGAVRGEILDDVRLAEAYARCGLPVVCAVGGGSIRMRSYPGGLRQLVRGWTKNIASGASAAAPLPGALSGLWISAHHAVAVGALLSVVEIVTGRGGSLAVGHPLVWAVAWVAVAWQLRSFLGRIGSFAWWTWALFGIPLLAFDLIFARSLLQTAVRGSVRWRGRDLDVRPPAKKVAP